jgi:hypothetical protein
MRCLIMIFSLCLILAQSTVVHATKLGSLVWLPPAGFGAGRSAVCKDGHSKRRLWMRWMHSALRALIFGKARNAASVWSL